MSLQAFDMKVHFGGVIALDGVDVEVNAGEVHGVIGPNGSGKSTLFNGFSGFVRLTSGRVVLDGHDVTHVPPHKRIHEGVARTFQTPRFRLDATVHETVACGFFPGISSGFVNSMLHLPKVLKEERAIERQTDALLERLGLRDAKESQIGELPLGRIRLVEVARALAMNPKYLLLDEPAAGLSDVEQDLLVGEVRRVAADGIGVMLVEHNFDLVLGVCDEIMVLNNGKALVSGPPAEVATNPHVLEAYLGVEHIEEVAAP